MTLETLDGDQGRQKAELLETALDQSERGLWSESVESNRAIVEIDPRDVSAHNRLGRSLTKLGRLREALEAYQRAVEVDPANAIALRNSARLQGVLENLEADTVPPANSSDLRADNFVMETGRSAVLELEDLSPADQIATILPGDTLELRADGPYLRLYTLAGNPVGVVPARSAQRLIELLNAGNEYSADVVAASVEGVSVLIREIYRSPDTRGKLPFPAVTRQAPDSRAGLRATLATSLEDEFTQEPDIDEDDSEDSEESPTSPLRDTDDADDADEE